MIRAAGKDDHLRFLKTVSFFAELPDEDLAWLAARGRLMEYFKNNFLFQHGDPADSLFVVVEGWIKLFHDNAQGEQTMQALLTRGDLYGAESVIDGRSYPSSAQISGKNAKVFVFPAAAVREKLLHSPELALRIIAALADELNRRAYLLEFFERLTAAQRLAAFLLKLSMDRSGVQNFVLPYNKFLVAERLGMKPETFSRAMKRLGTDLGIRFRGREVRLNPGRSLHDYCRIYCSQPETCPPEQRNFCRNPQCDIFRMLKLM